MEVSLIQQIYNYQSTTWNKLSYTQTSSYKKKTRCSQFKKKTTTITNYETCVRNYFLAFSVIHYSKNWFYAIRKFNNIKLVTGSLSFWSEIQFNQIYKHHLYITTKINTYFLVNILQSSRTVTTNLHKKCFVLTNCIKGHGFEAGI